MAKSPIQSSIDLTALVKRVAAGDECAFRSIFDAYKMAFFSAAYKMTYNSFIAEEITQEAFVNIWVKRQLVATARKPEDYIFGILHNCIYQYFRRQAREFRLKKEVQSRHLTAEDPVEQSIIDKELHQAFESVINQMPTQQKLVFRLAKQEELSREEIAHKLNLSPNTVRNHLAAAMDFLQRHLWKKGVYTLLLTLILK